MPTTTFEERLLPVLIEEMTVGRREPARPPRKTRAIASLVVVAIVAFTAVALLVGGSSDGTITVTVVSASMLPTLRPGDVVAVDTSAYESTLPSRGDIVAFRTADTSNIWIKRVIGLPGDIVSEVDGVVSVNGEELDEPYAELDHLSGSWVVEPAHVFVMGDSRAHSIDSRFTGNGAIGQVPIEAMVGKVLPEAVSGPPDIPAGSPGIASVSGEE